MKLRKIKALVLLVVMPCSDAVGYSILGGSWCLHLQDEKVEYGDGL
jgi:hypothetical protein